MPQLICIVDDDPIFVYTAKALMALHDDITEIVVCENGKEAFDYLQECHKGEQPLPDIVLLDLNMPVWDGWNFLDEYKALEKSVVPAIYILSSSDHADDVARGQKYELVREFLTKPLTDSALQNILDKSK